MTCLCAAFSCQASDNEFEGFNGTANGGSSSATGGSGTGGSTSGSGGSGIGGAVGEGGEGNVGEACATDQNCPAVLPVCDTSRLVCVGCLAVSDCDAGEECVGFECVPVPSCEDTEECDGEQICGKEGRCVECEVSTDCSGGEICVDQVCRLVCVGETECPDGASCDVERGICVGCLGDSECDEAQYCATNTCVDDVCVAGSATCSGENVVACSEVGDGWTVEQTCTDQEQCEQSGSDASCVRAGTGGSGGVGGGSGGSGAVAGNGGTAGAPNCDEQPLVWLLVSTSGSLSTSMIGDQTAWDATVDALVGPGGIVPEMQADVRFGLTLYGGSAPSCEPVSHVPPGPDAVGQIATALTEPRPVEGPKQESPASAAHAIALAAALEQPLGGGRHILFFGNDTPDFCDDGFKVCAQDQVVRAAQTAMHSGVRTLVVGVPGAPASGDPDPYFAALANAGVGLDAAPLYPVTDLPFVCDGPFANYSTAGGNAPYVLGAPEVTDLGAELSALLSGVTCL